MSSDGGVVVQARRTTSAVRAAPKKKAPRVKKPAFLTKEEAVKVVEEPEVPAWKADLLHRAKVGFYFGLWYALNIVYNSECWLMVVSLGCGWTV